MTKIDFTNDGLSKAMMAIQKAENPLTEIVREDLPLQEGLNFPMKPFQFEKLATTIRARLDR